MTADEVVKLDAPQICVQLASLGGSYKPHCFATQVTKNAHVSHAAMAFGSVSKDDNACEIFEARVSEMLATAFATIQAVFARRSKGVSAEHLSKVWCIPHDDAAHALGVRGQSLHPIQIHLCQEMLAPMIRLLDTGRSRVSSSWIPFL